MVVTIPAVAQPSREKSGFRPDIQGLRAIAVLMVVLSHAAPALIPGGYVGVDVFFVISGFLITTHLLETLDAGGRISVMAFYARRAVRLLPAAFTVLLLSVAASLIWMPPLQHQTVLLWALSAAIFAPNLMAGLLETDYLAESAPSVFRHYWSLGIEEQFYLVWPVLLALGWWTFGRSEKALFKATAVLVTASFVLCLFMTEASSAWAFFSPLTRAWELGTGALIAFLLRTNSTWLSGVPAKLVAWLGLALLLLTALIYGSDTPYPGYHAALPVIATALMIMGGAERTGVSLLLGVRPLQFIGLISYSLYLVHWPLLVIPQAAMGHAHPMPLWAALALGCLAVPMAYLLYSLVEKPARSLPKARGVKPERILLGAVSAIAVILVLVAAAWSVDRGRPLDSGRPGPAASIAPLPAGTGFVPADIAPPLRQSADDTALVYRNGCDGSRNGFDPGGCRFGDNPDAPLVALFGDSHAASWFPALHALAEQGDIRLDSNTASTCPSANVSVPIGPSFDSSCRQWRAEVVHRLNSEAPDVIVLANYAGRYQKVRDTNFFDEWSEGVADTIEALPKTSRVGVIADVPDMGESPAICLSAHLDDAAACAVPRSVALNIDLSSREEAAADAAGAAYLDLSDYFCGAASCHPIVGNYLTHRDGDHLSASFSKALSRPLMRELEALLK